MSMAEFLKRDMKSRQMNKAEYSRFLKIYPTELVRALQSEKLPSLNVQHKIANALGLSLDELLARVFSNDEDNAPQQVESVLKVAELDNKRKVKLSEAEIQVATWMDLWALSISLNKKNPEQPILTISAIAKELSRIDQEVGREPRNPETIEPILYHMLAGTRILFIELAAQIEIIGEVSVLVFPKGKFDQYDIKTLKIEQLPPQTLPGLYDGYLLFQMKPQFSTPANEQFLISTAEVTLSQYTKFNVCFDVIYSKAINSTVAILEYLDFERDSNDTQLYRLFVKFPYDKEFHFPSYAQAIEEIETRRKNIQEQVNDRLRTISVQHGIEILDQTMKYRKN